MKINKKFSITLLIAMFSLLIIGFGGAATVEAAGNCAETLLINVSTSESTAFTDCRALQAEAARYTGMAASDAMASWDQAKRLSNPNIAVSPYTLGTTRTAEELAAINTITASWDWAKRLSNPMSTLGTSQPVSDIAFLRLTNPNYFHPGR